MSSIEALRTGLLAVVVIDDDGETVARDEGLDPGNKLLDKGGIVVDGEVGDDIDRHAALVLEVVEPVHLLDVLVGGKGLHDDVLQLGTAVLARGNGIDAHRQDDAVPGKYLLTDATRQAVNLVGIHRVLDVDVQGTDLHVGAVIVDDDVKHALHTVKVVDFLLDLREQFGRNLGTEQFVDRRSEHLDTSLDDNQRDEGAQDTVKRDIPHQHHACRDERRQRDDSVEQSIGAGRDERVALEFLALRLDITAKHQFHDNRHDDDNERDRGIGGSGRLNDFFDGFDKRGHTCREHDDGDDDGAEVLDAPESEGVFPVGRALREFGAHDGNDTRERVAQVVHGIHNDGHRTRQNAYSCLKRSQQHVGNDANPTGSDNL